MITKSPINFLILLLLSLIILALVRDVRVKTDNNLNVYLYEINEAVSLNNFKACIHEYADDNDGNIPDSDKWCDQLILLDDLYLYDLNSIGSDCIEGESSYALNIAAAGKKLVDLPDDLVLIFEVEPDKKEGQRDFPIEQREFNKDNKYKGIYTGLVHKDRWNICCGPERLLLKPNLNYAYIIFAGGEKKQAKFDKLHELRWDIEGTDYSGLFRQKLQKIDEYKYKLQLKIGKTRNLSTACLAVLTIFTLIFYPIKRKDVFRLVIFTFLSAVCGFFFGAISHLLHNYNIHIDIGTSVGLYVGIAAGICYSAIMLNHKSDKGIGRPSFGICITYGIIFGILSSSIVHMSISYVSNEPMLPDMIFGGFFGAGAGLVLGIIFALAFARTKMSKTEQVNQEGEND